MRYSGKYCVVVIITQVTVVSRSTQEQARAEITKLKSDLAEANSRISLLVKEGDERHITLEKSRDRELL